MVVDEPFGHEQVELLFQWTRSDETWYLNELGRQPTKSELISYIQTYNGFGCKWTKWMQEGEPVAVSCVHPHAPSNKKPWIGTIVVNPKMRREGIGKAVIAKHRQVMNNVVFAGLPYECIAWSIFLGKCGFEQYGIEEDEGKEYLIMVCPE
ncbi:GNAT family N-acetyltransferase [Guptibacillus algicola]|uniref:GNAT family N-acetyltransferase n=1 Tax=Guptibacillus algicola TaxID=225844 RepID=UPI001CD7BB8B|nr:GNAT family N-acetyltransferase [Alkalihalobacillus algicola]MCA0987918.1 GNAT family N-acetyltransferase [Alkalihalobacillus algicola]